MQAFKVIEQVFESGKITMFTGDIEALKINMKNKKIEVDIENKDFIKRLIRMRGEIGNIVQSADEGSKEQKDGNRKSTSTLGTLRNVAEMLDSAGITLVVSYKGDTVVTLGQEAKPTLLHLVTRTRAIAINSLPKLIRMIR